MKLAARKGGKIDVARENIESYSTGDWDRLRKSLAPNVVYDEIGSRRRIEGADGLVKAYQGWKRALPDGKGTVRNAIASGDTVVIEVEWSGTQTGPLETSKGVIPPSGKAITLAGCQVIKIEDGKVREFRQYFDMLTILQQIGAAPV